MAISATDAGALPFNVRRKEISDSPLDDAKEAVADWWGGLTHEQRRWLVIAAVIVVLFLLYKFA